MKIGYARVSTKKQSLDAQRAQLRAFGCTKIYTDKVSGKKAHKPGLARALAALKPGDTLVVWKVDRLGRLLKYLIGILEEVESKNVRLRSISDEVDTDMPTGRLHFHMLGAFAEFEGVLSPAGPGAGCG